MLEQKLYLPISVQISESSSRNFKSKDLELLSVLALYTPPIIIRDFPSLGFQLHLHGPNLNDIQFGKLKSYSGETLKTLNGYESSMADLYADLLKFPKISLPED